MGAGFGPAAGVPSEGGGQQQAVEPPLVDSTADSCFTQEQLEDFGQFLGEHGVQSGTQVNYRQGWDLWGKFLPGLPTAQRPTNVYLDSVEGDRDKALYVLAFALHLYRTRKWRGSQVTHCFPHIRHHFFAAVRSTSFLDHPLIDKTRKAVVMSPQERVMEVQCKIDSCLLPLSYPLLDWGRVQYWVQTPWHTDKGRLRKATYLAGSMMVDSGNRVSNATGPTTDAVLGVPADHGVKTKQVEVTIAKGKAKTFKLHGAVAIRGYLQDPKTPKGVAADEQRFPGVIALRITFLTQKVVKDDEGPPEPLYYARREERESRFIDDMTEWLCYSTQLLDTDYLFTAYQCAPKPGAKTDKRLLQRRDVAEMFKASAVAKGLDPSRFSTSSARRFAASNKALSMAEIKKRGGWNESSSVPESHYRRNGESRGV
jgi:hypothetical protein